MRDADETTEFAAPSPREIMRRRALSHAGFLLGTGFVLAISLLAAFAPAVTPFDPFAQNLDARLINPVWGNGGTWSHPLGTDSLGRDYLTRILYGARISLIVGLGRGRHLRPRRIDDRIDRRVFRRPHGRRGDVFHQREAGPSRHPDRPVAGVGIRRLAPRDRSAFSASCSGTVSRSWCAAPPSKSATTSS